MYVSKNLIFIGIINELPECNSKYSTDKDTILLKYVQSSLGDKQ